MLERQDYRVEAQNLARNSENKMHDDTVARRFGFAGGLVAGVDVFAYMTHLPVARWGRAFLERGRVEARFLKPVYDGETVIASAVPQGEGLALALESRGETCASGHASLPAVAPPLSLDDFPRTSVVAERAPVGPSSYAEGSWLGIPPWRQGEVAMAEYLAGVRETQGLYARERIVHPGMLLRTMNWALMENAKLGPWIHVGSTIRYLATAGVEDELSVRAKVTGNYERKGHKFVELDGLIVANGSRPIARCQHIAIYQPRETMAA